MGSPCRYLDLWRTVTVSFGRLTLLATVTGGLPLSAPCAADSTVWFTAGPAAVTLRLPARWTADTVDFLLLALPAVLSTRAGVISAVTAAFAVVLLAVGTDTLALDLLAGVTTPWAGVHWFATDFTAVAGLLGPTACAAAATRVVDLGSSTA